MGESSCICPLLLWSLTVGVPKGRATSGFPPPLSSVTRAQGDKGVLSARDLGTVERLFPWC